MFRNLSEKDDRKILLKIVISVAVVVRLLNFLVVFSVGCEGLPTITFATVFQITVHSMVHSLTRPFNVWNLVLVSVMRCRVVCGVIKPGTVSFSCSWINSAWKRKKKTHLQFTTTFHFLRSHQSLLMFITMSHRKALDHIHSINSLPSAYAFS